MKSHRIFLKLYAESSSVPPAARFVEVFHDWIKDSALAETMIDVADYGHVHRGPSVLFVGHESDYALDLGEGRVGLSYTRKRAPDDGPQARLADSFRRLFTVAARLEAEPRLAPLSFRSAEVLLRVLDRLHAPNLPSTLADEKEGILEEATRVLGAGVELSHEGEDPREPFTVRLRAHSSSSESASARASRLWPKPA